MPTRNFLFGLFTFVLVLVLSISSVSYISKLPITISNDSIDNLKRAHAFATYGSIGIQEDNHVRPDHFREPFPIAVTAGWIQLIPALSKINNVEDIWQGKPAVLLKLQNLVFIFLTLLGVSVLTFEVYKNLIGIYWTYFATIFVLLLTNACIHKVYANTLLTEFHAACLLTWFSWAWIKGLQSTKKRFFVFAGLLYGLLILTKAAMLYIGIVASFMIFFLLYWNKSKKLILPHFLLIILVNLVVLPWYVRNYIQLGEWQLTQRAPVVLLTRANKDLMSDEEFKGAFYAYAPAGLKGIMTTITGFNDEDRGYGKRLERFKRFHKQDMIAMKSGDIDQVVGFYARSETQVKHAMISNYNKYGDYGVATKFTNQEIQKLAIAQMFANWPKHIKSSFLFAWRGAWPANKVDGYWDLHEKKPQFFSEIIPFMGLLTTFLIGLNALVKREMTVLALTIISMGSYLFYAFFTHFIPRYSEMFIPIWIISFGFAMIKFSIWRIQFFNRNADNHLLKLKSA